MTSVLKTSVAVIAIALAVTLSAQEKKIDDRTNVTSLDQMYAQKFGQTTPIPSMQMYIEGLDQSGGCQYGYSCAYVDSLSWATPNKPLPIVGRAGRVLPGGVHVKAPNGTPLANAMPTILHALGVEELKTFGDSEGTLALA